MLPKKDIRDIQIQINNGVLGVEQYEFICLRLIDTIKQLEEQVKEYKTEKQKSNVATLVSNVGYEALYINNERVYKGDHLLLEKTLHLLSRYAPISKLEIKQLTEEAFERHYEDEINGHPYYLSDYGEKDFV